MTPGSARHGCRAADKLVPGWASLAAAGSLAHNRAVSWLALAGVLAVTTAVAHSWLGERYILVRLFRRGGVPKLFGGEWFTRRTLRFAWHLTSVAWTGFAALLFALAAAEPSELRVLSLRVVAATFLLHAVIAAAASRGRHLAWPVFLAIAALAWLAA